MFDKCKSCGNKENKSLYIVTAKNEDIVYCRDCRSGTAKAPPDVYYGHGSGVQYEENIADRKTGKPIPFYDKTSKAAAMKQAMVQEAGDKVHGARNEYGKRKTYFTGS